LGDFGWLIGFMCCKIVIWMVVVLAANEEKSDEQKEMELEMDEGSIDELAR